MNRIRLPRVEVQGGVDVFILVRIAAIVGAGFGGIHHPQPERTGSTGGIQKQELGFTFQRQPAAAAANFQRARSAPLALKGSGEAEQKQQAEKDSTIFHRT